MSSSTPTKKATRSRSQKPKDEVRPSTDPLQWSEARRAESVVLFKEVFFSSPASIALARLPKGEFIEVNEAFLNWSGYQRHEVLGRTTTELDFWALSEDRNAFFSEVIKTGRIRNRECQLRARDGHVETVLVSGTLVKLEGQEHVLTVGLRYDDEKQARLKLQQTLHEEQELRMLKSKFVALVSHEFRNPLGVIVSAAEILESYSERLPTSKRAEHLSDIKSAAFLMTGLLERMLTLERSESSKDPLVLTPVSVKEFCERVRYEVEKGQPQCPRIEIREDGMPTTVLADESLLRNALSNVLTNAVKYSISDGKVLLTLKIEKPWAVFEVKDQGIGIPALDQKHLFEPFYRASNVGAIPGTGLGLVTVKKCVERHGGQIRIHSVENDGTIVSLLIPLEAESKQGEIK